MLVFMHMYNEMLTISMSSTMSSTLNLNLRMTQIGIRCSRAKKYSQRYQIGYFCQGFFSCIQPSEIPLEIPPELPAEMLIKLPAEIPLEVPPEILLEVAVSKSDTKLPC